MRQREHVKCIHQPPGDATTHSLVGFLGTLSSDAILVGRERGEREGEVPSGNFQQFVDDEKIFQVCFAERRAGTPTAILQQRNSIERVVWLACRVEACFSLARGNDLFLSGDR